MSFMDVYSSVAQANSERGARTSTGRACPRCNNRDWHARNGVDSRYAGQNNPGEYVEFTCAHCGYSYEEQS